MTRLDKFYMVARHFTEASTKEPSPQLAGQGILAIYTNNGPNSKRGPAAVYGSREAATKVARALAGRVGDPGHFVVLEAVELIGPPETVIKVVSKPFGTEVGTPSPVDEDPLSKIAGFEK